MKLRRAREDDCKLLWEWASDPTVRSMSFSSASIPWEEHVSWFTQKLRDPNCFIFIAVNDQDLPVGQARFDLKNKHEAEIGVIVAGSRRGLGYGSAMIALSVSRLFSITPVRTIHAYIKSDNQGSIKAFEKAGFNKLGLETVKGRAAHHYIRSESDALTGQE